MYQRTYIKIIKQKKDQLSEICFLITSPVFAMDKIKLKVFFLVQKKRLKKTALSILHIAQYTVACSKMYWLRSEGRLIKRTNGFAGHQENQNFKQEN